MDSLNTILNSGTYGENVSRHNDNNSKIKQAITTLENVAIANKGYFDTLASLQAAFPSPKAGNIAYVANAASSTGYYIYNVVSGVWTATSTEAPAVDVAINNYAQHGYSSSPKTLKQVDDEVVQLAGDTMAATIRMEQGAFQSGSGEEIASTKYLRSGFINYELFTEINIPAGNEYVFYAFRMFDKEKQYIGSRSDFFIHDEQKRIILPQLDNVAYFRFSVKKTDNSDIFPDADIGLTLFGYKSKLDSQQLFRVEFISGNPIDTTKRVTTDYVEYDKVSAIEIGTDYEFLVSVYDSNKTWIEYRYQWSRGTIMLPYDPNVYFFRVSIRKISAPDGVIRTNENTGLKFHCHKYLLQQFDAINVKTEKRVVLREDDLVNLHPTTNYQTTELIPVVKGDILYITATLWESVDPEYRTPIVGYSDDNYGNPVILYTPNKESGDGASKSIIRLPIEIKSDNIKFIRFSDIFQGQNHLVDMKVEKMISLREKVDKLSGTQNNIVANIYKISHDENTVTLHYQNEGSITFNIAGNTHIAGDVVDGFLIRGRLVRVLDSPQKTEVFSFDLSENDSNLVMSYEVTYKQGVATELEGMLGTVSGEMGFDKNSNISVEGTAGCVGYLTDEATQFGVLTYYGEWARHDDKATGISHTSIARKAGDVYRVKMKVMRNVKAVQLLCQPNGRNATFTFVNHADHQTAARTKAIFYGSDNPSNASHGKGIHSKGIKGTWSVFAKSSGSGADKNEGLDSAAYKTLCQQLYTEGTEIVPHTISYNPDYRQDFVNYLPLFSDFSPRNWVDHMLRTTNPSSGLHSQGNDPNSPNYVMDLMEQFDYCWSYIDTEDYPTTHINQLYDGRFAFPSYLVYQNEKLSRPVNGKMWQYQNVWTTFRHFINSNIDIQPYIDKLILDCGVWTEHSYFAMYTRQDIFWKMDGNDTVITDELSSILSVIQTKIAAGELWNPTMTEFLDYLVNLLDISIIHKGGCLEITNKGSNTITGCSFKINNYFDTPTLNNVRMNRKIVSGGVIVWGDVPEGTSIMQL